MGFQDHKQSNCISKKVKFGNLYLRHDLNYLPIII